MTFEELKLAWPTGKRGSNLKRAAELFAKIPVSEHGRLMAGLAAWKRSKKWVDGYVPHIRTFLHQRQWEDVLEEAPDTSESAISDKDWALYRYWASRVGRDRAERCEHQPECVDGEAHVARVVRTLRARGA